MTWEDFYNYFGIKDFIYFISNPALQDYLFPVKLVFVCFAMIFLVLVIYFMINSSWLQYKFLEDVTEFFAWQAYGTKEMSKKWSKISKRVSSGSEADLKLAVIEANDLLEEVLEKRGFEGDDFPAVVEKAGKLLAQIKIDVLVAHDVRNSIVYNPDFKLSSDQAKKVLNTFEMAINSIGM